MESFLWILLYLCLTRDGPGGSRREELKGENCGGDANSVEQIVYCFFDSEDKHDLAHNRKLLFNDHEDMKNHIVKQFHPYFDVLKPLVIEWWRLLRFAYYSGSYTPMHQPLLGVLDNTLEDIAKMPPSTPSAATLAELERRKQDLAVCAYSGRSRRLLTSGGRYNPGRSNAPRQAQSPSSRHLPTACEHAYDRTSGGHSELMGAP